MDSKPWWMSKTLWANAIMFSVIIAQNVFTDVSADWMSIQAAALGAVNIGLRLVTKQPISDVKVLPE